MSKRSTIGCGSILRLASRLYKYPWIYSSLAGLQLEKTFFNQIGPKGGEGDANKIRQVSIRITDLCNLRCIMCGQWGEHGFLHGKNLKELKKCEVPVERYQELLRDLAAHGHRPILYLWGGEPTMYNGWLDLLETAKELKMPSSIVTNGTKLAQYADRIIDSSMYLCQISIDGHNEELHNSIRRAQGINSFKSINEGIDALQEARARANKKLPLIASLTTVSRDNANNLVDIYEAFKDKVDLCVFYPAWWISEERADAHTKDFERRFGFEPQLHRGWIGGWTPQDYKALNEQFQELRARSKGYKNPPVIFIPNLDGEEDLEKYYTDHSERFGYDECISIFQVIEIDSNGDISPCRDYHDYVVGNVKDQTITEIWNSDRFKQFRKSISQDGLMPVCSRCCGLMGY
ncbi:radical SAM/SPASM domain-containing protein [Oceanidesulfovibrio marinus]|uniref:Radical SAM protein n=1 Tax=Oceanidesulfovibrio marinus TaxID=370038 RepID=A0ABX6NEE4_9BACT|nr:radical SAM protein [Oceanidesulfovibrio marinus]QJT08423.1 radical SAM protein [Oceanidesulfovibrio marinus]